jgi:hypothetical protein
MIRNVVLAGCGRIDPALIDEPLAGIVALEIPGTVVVRVGRDAGLRSGNWDYAITSDVEDEDAYRRYDQDESHNRLRRDAFEPLSVEIARLQFEI